MEILANAFDSLSDSLGDIGSSLGNIVPSIDMPDITPSLSSVDIAPTSFSAISYTEFGSDFSTPDFGDQSLNAANTVGEVTGASHYIGYILLRDNLMRSYTYSEEEKARMRVADAYPDAA